MRSHVYRTEAVVLRRTDYSEADRILTLYTPRFGKRRAIAKGVRKTTSRLAGHVELFTRVELLLAEGRNLDIVTQAEIVAPYRALREDLGRISYAYYDAVLDLRLSEPTSREVEDLLRLTIRPILERDLKSIQFVNAVRS